MIEFKVPELGENVAGGDVMRGLAAIRIDKALSIGVRTDILFPLQQQEEIAEGLRAGEIEPVEDRDRRDGGVVRWILVRGGHGTGRGKHEPAARSELSTHRHGVTSAT